VTIQKDNPLIKEGNFKSYEAPLDDQYEDKIEDEAPIDQDDQYEDKIEDEVMKNSSKSESETSIKDEISFVEP